MTIKPVAQPFLIGLDRIANQCRGRPVCLLRRFRVNPAGADTQVCPHHICDRNPL